MVIPESEKRLLNDKMTSADQTVVSFSNALEQTKYGKFNYFVIAISGFVLANVLLVNSSVAFFMPVAHCELHLTDSRKSLLSCISFVGMVVSSHLWGFLADTKGRRRIIRPTLLAGFVVTVLSSFATNFWIMLFLRFITGICVCSGSAVIYAYLGEFHVDRTRAQAIMFASFIFALGALLQPFISFSIINREWKWYIPLLDFYYKPWRLYIIVSGSLGLICGIALYFLPESPKFLLSIKKEKESRQVLQKMYKMNGGKGELSLDSIIPDEDFDELTQIQTIGSNTNMISKFLQTMWNQTVPLFHRKYLRTTLILSTAQFWLCFITFGLYMWFPYIENAMSEFMKQHPDEKGLMCDIIYDDLQKLYGTNQTEEEVCIDKLENNTFVYSFTLEISHFIVFVILCGIIKYIGNITILVVIIVVFSSCGLVAVWLPYPAIAAFFYAYLYIVGAGINVLGSATVDLYPTQLRGMAACISAMIGCVGSVAGTIFVGMLLSLNCEATFYVTCFGMMSCAVLLRFLPKPANEITLSPVVNVHA